jgi:hypothetical protein
MSDLIITKMEEKNKNVKLLTEQEKDLQFENHVKEVLSTFKGFPFSYVILVLKTAITKAQSSAIIPD